MWLISSTSSQSVPAPDSPTLACTPPSSFSATGRVFWPTVSGKPTPRPASWPEWKRKHWAARLFSAETCAAWTPGLCAGLSTCSPPACLANHTATPESAAASPTSAVMATETGHCRTSCESSQSVSPPWFFSKTSLPGFEEDISDRLAKNYADWVTHSKARSLSLRKTLAQATSASASSSWPTANVATGDYSYSNGDHARKVLNLEGAAKKWQTPNLPNGGGQTRGGARSGELLLEGQAAKWQAPSASEWGGTPEQHLERKRKAKAGAKMGLCVTGLHNQVQKWSTPAARDYRTPNSAASQAKRAGNENRTQQLANQVVHEFSHPAPTTSDGPTSSPPPPSSPRRLNPAFVCWLMGAPRWWTRPESTSCDALGMDAFHSRLQQLLSLCFAKRSGATNAA